MKIGILTYHRAVNDGSILQAYCIQKVLSSHFPNARVEIIDYCPAQAWWNERRQIICKRPPFLLRHNLAKMKSVYRFIKDHFVLSPQSCVTNDLGKAIRFVERQNYDVVFVGSDTVWEGRSSNYCPKPPNIYYLPGLNNVKKVSFAASADPLHPEFISNGTLLAAIAPCIKGFDHITFRDRTTQEYLSRVGVSKENLHFMPDPTLQYDFKKFVQRPEINKNRPWAGVGFAGEVRKVAFNQLKDNGYDVINLSNFTMNGKPIPGARESVNIRLGVYSMLDFLITDRFHGSIFAFKLSDAQVVFFESPSKWPIPNSKGRDLFKRLGVESMVLRYEEKKIFYESLEKSFGTWKKVKSNVKKNLILLKNKSEIQLSKIKELCDKS